MALKKFDISEVCKAGADERNDELRQSEIDAQNNLAGQIRIFVKEAPDIMEALDNALMKLDAQKFSTSVSDNMKKTVSEMTRTFIAGVKPTVDRIDNRKRVSLPSLVFYVAFETLIWLLIFFALVVYASGQPIVSETLPGITGMTFLFWLVSTAVIIYLSRKFKW